MINDKSITENIHYDRQPNNNGMSNFTNATSDPNYNVNTDNSIITSKIITVCYIVIIVCVFIYNINVAATNNNEEESVDTNILIIPIVLSSCTFGIALIILGIILTTVFIRKYSGRIW